MGFLTLLSPPPSTVASNQAGAFALLCACCAVRPDPKQSAQIAGWPSDNFNWQEFLRQAEHHGVLALAARNLLDHAPSLPPEIQRTLESAYAANFRRGLWFAAELKRIAQHLAQKGVRAIPYKGPVLAQSAYGDLALRSFSDLDLLISPAGFAPAKNALAELGYQPSKPLTPAIERLWLKTGYERSFDGPGGKNIVELQWAPLPFFYAVDPGDFRFDDLWARAGHIVLGGGNDSGVPCLSPEDSLLALCLHAAKHLWTRLIWVADIAESLRVPDIDLALVIARARSLGIKRILGVSFWLAQDVIGIAIPAIAQEVIESDSEVKSIGEECAARLSACASYDLESTVYFRQILLLRERASDRRRYVWRLVFTPSEGDIEAVALPEPMFPLYRGVRLARLLRKILIPKR